MNLQRQWRKTTVDYLIIYFVSEILFSKDDPSFPKLAGCHMTTKAISNSLSSARYGENIRIIELFVLEGALKIMSHTIDRGVTFH